MRSGGLLQRMLRHYSPLVRARGKALKAFSDKVGLVYFGSVDQHVDEHDVIRGLTVSTTHKDTHYAVGSYDGYDVSMVDRFDVLVNHAKKPIEHSWLIMRVSLRGGSLPHVFFTPRGHSPEAYNSFFTAFNTLHSINEVFDAVHDDEFHARYEVYGLATHTPELESFITPEVTRVLAARFWPHAIEIFDGNVYVYITEHRRPELEAVLGPTLQSAVWLASVVDAED